MDRPDATPLLSKDSNTGLIVVGKDDQIIPIDEAQAMNDLMP